MMADLDNILIFVKVAQFESWAVGAMGLPPTALSLMSAGSSLAHTVIDRLGLCVGRNAHLRNLAPSNHCRVVAAERPRNRLGPVLHVAP